MLPLSRQVRQGVFLGFQSSIGLLFLIGLSTPSHGSEPGGGLVTLWKASAPEKSLQTWSWDEMKRLKSASVHERDPQSGAIVHWQGPLVEDLIEKAMDSLPLEQKAQVDLVIFRNRVGAQAQIPRWLVNRYPILMGFHKNALRLVLPFHTRPKISEEGLPLASYELDDVVEIDLSNYRQNYGAFYLKRRTDPMAIRGEKLFVENCTSCHSAGVSGHSIEAVHDGDGGRGLSVSDLSLEGHARRLASNGHPQTKNFPKLKARDLRALVSYLDEFRAENAPSADSKSTGSSLLNSLTHI